ncbi:hypothetical protein H2248_011280 [Termitomyces sp. 'cryptogamus']|nr:hypothetical protein H2248_011280 [Termitomyces sp. 'cryptogamus']
MPFILTRIPLHRSTRPPLFQARSTLLHQPALDSDLALLSLDSRRGSFLDSMPNINHDSDWRRALSCSVHGEEWVRGTRHRYILSFCSVGDGNAVRSRKGGSA